MYRIITPTGLIDVTDDHSLINIQGQEVSPNDVTIGTELLHRSIRHDLDYLFTSFIYLNNTYDPSSININQYFNNYQEKISFKIGSNHEIIAKIFMEANLRGLEPELKIDNTGTPYLTIDKIFCNYIENENAVIYKQEIEYPSGQFVYDLTTENHHFAGGIGNMIVHNTDSVFFKFNLTDKETGEKIIGEKALELSIEIAQDACHNVSKVLKQPHDFEYEKTFMPFCLLSKKRYVSIKYEFDPKKGKRNEMGIVLKRRDNAPIVKDVYGGVIDILMKEKNIQKAINYVHKCLQDLVDGNVPIEKLIITKSLRSFYKNPQSIAHKVLADRIALREPGNKPTSGDRIPFVYIVTKNIAKGVKVLQGDKIETPSFIKENNLEIDYSFYITNQIMKPLLQLFGLVVEDILLAQKPPRRVKATEIKNGNIKFRSLIEANGELTEEEKKEEKSFTTKIKDKTVKELIFDKYLRETDNKKNKNQSITGFFNKK